MIDKLIKEFPRALAISTFVFIALLLLKIATGVGIDFDSSLVVFYLYTFLYSFSLYYANAFLFIVLDDQFVHNRFSAQRIGLGLLFSFLISTVIIFLLRILEDVFIEGESWNTFIDNENRFDYLISIVMTFFVTLVFHVFYFYKSFQENKVQEQKIIATTANAQFESLKNQIDPHFLFNSLNVLSSLIEENPENAQKFTTSLSKIYRYVLEQKDKELVAVTEELAFAKIYMQLLEMRFENSISYELP